MNNADLPAYPLDNETCKELDSGHWYCWLGLTKREAFTLAAMQGLCTNGSMIDGGGFEQIRYLNAQSIKIADGQLKALEAT